MEVRYIYSACVVIKSEELTLCCDPWFTPGIYYGSWYQYPPLAEDPIDVIGEVDAIYVSHIHPDHYDSRFLKRYLNCFPDTEIIIGETEPHYLSRLMRSDGLNPIIVGQAHFGSTNLHIFANRAYEFDSIDTALVVSRGALSVANLNDNPFDQQQVNDILSVCPLGRPTFALLPYSGAGPYPQTYELATDEAHEAAAGKKRQFLDLYSRYLQSLQPHKAMPFAGQYWLGGPLICLNDQRGVPDATEVLSQHSDTSVVLADGGQAFIDLETLKCSAARTKPYDAQEVRRYLDALPFKGFDFEQEIDSADALPDGLLKLTQLAYDRAIGGTKVKEPFWVCLKADGSDNYMVFDTFQDTGVTVIGEVSHLEPRCEILIDGRFLKGLLEGQYHWSLAEIGSQYRAKRVPNVYRREVYSFLNRLHV